MKKYGGQEQAYLKRKRETLNHLKNQNMKTNDQLIKETAPKKLTSEQTLNLKRICENVLNGKGDDTSTRIYCYDMLNAIK